MHRSLGKGELPRELAFMPNVPTGENHVGAGQTKELSPIDNMPGFRWELPQRIAANENPLGGAI
jgi:hypothetical protein